MKCDTVQSAIVEYAEGGLCVADELCVDIHLVQCPGCREDLLELGAFQSMFSRGLAHPEPRNHLRDLLVRLDSVGTPCASRVGLGERQRFRSGAMLRFSMAMALSALALFGGALGWGKDSLPYFQLPVVEADTGLHVPEAWRPWMRRNYALRDGETLEEILSPGVSGLPW